MNETEKFGGVSERMSLEVPLMQEEGSCESLTEGEGQEDNVEEKKTPKKIIKIRNLKKLTAKRNKGSRQRSRKKSLTKTKSKKKKIFKKLLMRKQKLTRKYNRPRGISKIEPFQTLDQITPNFDNHVLAKDPFRSRNNTSAGIDFYNPGSPLRREFAMVSHPTQLDTSLRQYRTHSNNLISNQKQRGIDRVSLSDIRRMEEEMYKKLGLSSYNMDTFPTSRNFGISNPLTLPDRFKTLQKRPADKSDIETVKHRSSGFISKFKIRRKTTMRRIYDNIKRNPDGVTLEGGMTHDNLLKLIKKSRPNKLRRRNSPARLLSCQKSLKSVEDTKTEKKAVQNMSVECFDLPPIAPSNPIQEKISLLGQKFLEDNIPLDMSMRRKSIEIDTLEMIQNISSESLPLFGKIHDKEELFEDFSRDIQVDFLHQKTNTPQLKVGKRIDLDNNIMLFEEDFYRKIDFLTFENKKLLQPNIYKKNSLQVRSKNSDKSMNLGMRLLGKVFSTIKVSTCLKKKEKGRNQAEIVIDGEFYKIGELIHPKLARVRTGLAGLEMKFTNTSPQPPDELQMDNKFTSTIRIENRKNKIIENIIKDNNFSPVNKNEGDNQESQETILPVNNKNKNKSKFSKSKMHEKMSEISASSFSRCSSDNSDEPRRNINRETNQPSLVIENLSPKKDETLDSKNKVSADSSGKEEKKSEDQKKPKINGMLQNTANKVIQSKKKKLPSSFTELFNSNARFQQAVKINRAETQNDSEMRIFRASMVEPPIISMPEMTKCELELISKFTTGYSYAVDINEDKLFSLNQVREIQALYESSDHLIQEITEGFSLIHEKVFSFLNCDNSKVTNDADRMNDDNVKQLLTQVNFANAKRGNKLMAFKHASSQSINDLKDQSKHQEIERITKEYSKQNFYEISLNRVLGEGRTIPRSNRFIDIKFLGIVSYINYFNILRKEGMFMCNYNNVSKWFLRKKKKSNWESYIRNIQENSLDLVYKEQRKVNSWLYQRDSVRELQDIIFFDVSAQRSPRIHASPEYQAGIMKKVDELYLKFYIKARSTQAELVKPKMYKSKKAFQRYETKPLNSLSFSGDVSVIPYGIKERSNTKRTRGSILIKEDTFEVKGSP
ncbi:unnamed protein product [Moneuplotes crassus]|uniref:Uncharacterized protein n=1 Tax=Euplotes crassus TaxID=5936 RepID=A0AAD2D6K3_EUPCR|nr:unnamed protein product [Moneuplotes crassus]